MSHYRSKLQKEIMFELAKYPVSTLTRLSDILKVSSTTISKSVKLLKEQGLVMKEKKESVNFYSFSCLGNPRKTISRYSLTEEGHKEMKRILEEKIGYFINEKRFYDVTGLHAMYCLEESKKKNNKSVRLQLEELRKSHGLD